LKQKWRWFPTKPLFGKLQKLRGEHQDMNNLFNVVKCPVCQNDKYRVIKDATYPEDLTEDQLRKSYSSSSDKILMDQLVTCSSCELIYINPQLRDDIIIGGYQDAIDPTFITQNNARIKTFSNSLDWIIEILGISRAEDFSVLDVGCAGGAFPMAAHSKGFSVVGIEPSKWLSQKARETYGLDIRTGTLSEQNFEKNKFDIISLWDVIEHLTNPKDVLFQINDLLRNGGTLVINYPNYSSLARKIFRQKWPFFLSVHLIYFTPKTIKLLLKQSGFEVIKEKSYWQKLELGYAMNRAGSYFSVFKYINHILKLLSMEKLQISYNMGQTLLIAKKFDAVK
jgi:2-polyprenyl-3-methyl-5-hydroxy-6-metoxy-1,4-benzoquinol methylase